MHHSWWVKLLSYNPSALPIEFWHKQRATFAFNSGKKGNLITNNGLIPFSKCLNCSSGTAEVQRCMYTAVLQLLLVLKTCFIAQVLLKWQLLFSSPPWSNSEVSHQRLWAQVKHGFKTKDKKIKFSSKRSHLFYSPNNTRTVCWWRQDSFTPMNSCFRVRWGHCWHFTAVFISFAPVDFTWNVVKNGHLKC